MPTTTTGVATEFITFSRPGATGGGATVTDSDGRVKWAPHNLLLASESFDAASWARYLVATVTANAAVAPNGATTADVVSVSASGSLYSSVSVIGGAKYKISVWAKRNAGSNQTFVLYGGANISSDLTATADWQLFEYEFTAASTASINCGFNVGSGNAAFNVYLWGASLYRSDLGGMQPNTSAYPMYNPTTPKNLLGYTEDFSNAAWGSFNTTETINQLTLTSTSGGATQSKTLVNGGVYTLQCKIKKGTNNFAYLNVQGSSVYASAVFDLVNGVTGETKVSGAGFAVSSHTISTADTDGYFTCRATFTVAAASVVLVGFAPAATGNTFDAFGNPTGCTSGNTLFVKQAQLSDSASLDSYVPVYGAAVTSAAYYGPRRDFDPVTLACKGLLVEEQRANLQLNSNVFGTSTFAATVVAGAAASPSGLIDASSLACTSTSGRAILSTSVTSGVVYTFSVFIKAGTNTSAYIELAGTSGSGGQVVFNLSNGTVTSGTGGAIVPAPNGFYRCSVTSTATGTGASDMRIGTGDATSKTVFVYGAQLEQNASFATSYIPVGSTSAGATRLADVASVSTQAFPYSSTAGSWVVYASFQQTTGVIATVLNDGNVAISASPATATESTMRVYKGTAPPVNLVNGANITSGTLFKYGAGYITGSNASGFVSGATNNAFTNPDLVSTVVYLGDGTGLGAYGFKSLNGYIRQITYIPRRLSNAELQTRTS